MRAAKRTSLVILAVLAVLLIVGVAAGSQRSACSSCHVMQPYAQALSATEHQGLHCYDCHLTDGAWDYPAFKTAELTRMYPAALLAGRDSLEGSGRRVSDRACLECHAGLLNETTDTGGLRIDHDACRADATPCDDCHADTAHPGATRWARGFVMEYCVRCHLDAETSIDCDRCHEGKIERERLARGPWRVTHGAEWPDTHGMGTIEYCETCHDPSYCTKCHGTPLPHSSAFGGEHGSESLLPEATCSTCHDRATFCDTCHGIEMPHPASFLPEHPDTAESVSDELCLTCHVSRDCVTCHVDHTHPGSTDGTIGDFELSIGGR